MIFLRAWYLEMPQQPPPPGVLEDGVVWDEPSGMVDGPEHMPDESLTHEEDQKLKLKHVDKCICLSLLVFCFLVSLELCL